MTQSNVTARQLFLLIACNQALGTDRKYLLPNLDGAKAIESNPELTAAFGNMGTLINDDANAGYFLDPSTLPCPEALEEELIQFTHRTMAAALSTEDGYPGRSPVKGETETQKWNNAVEHFAKWLSEPEAIAEEVTPVVEVEPAPLTAEQENTVVEAAVEDDATVEAARELVEETLGVVVANAMSDDSIIKTALGLGLHKAQSTAADLTDAGIADIKDAAFSFVEAITKALNKLGASAEIQRGVINSIQSALPEQVAEEIKEEIAA